MIERQVILPFTVRDDIGEIADFIVELSTREYAMRYVYELISEIADLSYIADALPVSTSLFVLQYHEKAKRYNVKHGIWCVIFHVEGYYVIVDKILAAKMIVD